MNDLLTWHTYFDLYLRRGMSHEFGDDLVKTDMSTLDNMVNLGINRTINIMKWLEYIGNDQTMIVYLLECMWLGPMIFYHNNDG